MQITIAAEPRFFVPASARCRTLLRMAYRIGPDSTLLSLPLSAGLSGGLLGLSDCSAPEIPDPAALARSLVQECRKRHYSGVVLDVDHPHRPDLQQLAVVLGKFLPPARLSLWGPEALASPALIPVLSTAISGGALADMLRQAAARHHGRFALYIQRLRMDFLLPSRSGTGQPLTESQLNALREETGSPTFFSRELCAQYFSYAKNGQVHIVLFDDAHSLRQKLRLAESAGCLSAFLLWPEIADLTEK